MLSAIQTMKDAFCVRMDFDSSYHVCSVAYVPSFVESHSLDVVRCSEYVVLQQKRLVAVAWTYTCGRYFTAACLRWRVQLLWNGSLPRAGDDPAATLRRVCGFLAVRLLRVRAVCGAFTILAASQTKKVHSGKYPQRSFRVPIGGARTS